jgi:uncharacterized protein
MTNVDKCRVIVFAKAPIAGEVKTRLCPPLSVNDAAELQRRMLRHALNTASRADLGPIELYCAPEISHPDFNQCQDEFKLELKRQVDGDLGVKMKTALINALTQAEYAVLIGTDCPSITPDYLREAVAALSDQAPVVFGPAEDGGYGLIGVRRATPEIFIDIPWGSAEVMKSTRNILMVKQLAWRELAPIWDVDRPDDLARLARDANLNYLVKGLIAAPTPA